MRCGIIALTKGGLGLARKIREIIPPAYIYTLKKWGCGDCGVIDGPLESFTGVIFRKHEILIFITAAGIAVRAISKHLGGKKEDPGVLVMDETGKYVISLLSGHLGGANEAAEFIAKKIGARPVITTSSDVQGLISVDMTAKKYGLHISDMAKAKDVTSLIVNGFPAALVNETGMEIENPYSHNIEDAMGIIYVTNRVKGEGPVPSVALIPENIVIGIGCRKGVNAADITGFIEEKLFELNLYPESIKRLATAEVKSEEQGIIDASTHFSRRLEIISLDEISRVENMFDKSEYVKNTIGVYSVSEPCAYLASNRTGKMILKKSKKEGITIALWEEEK